MFKLTQGEPSEQQVVLVVVVATLMVLYAFLLVTVAVCGWLQNQASDTRPTGMEPKQGPTTPAVAAARSGHWTDVVEQASPTGSAV